MRQSMRMQKSWHVLPLPRLRENKIRATKCFLTFKIKEASSTPLSSTTCTRSLPSSCKWPHYGSANGKYVIGLWRIRCMAKIKLHVRMSMRKTTMMKRSMWKTSPYTPLTKQEYMRMKIMRFPLPHVVRNAQPPKRPSLLDVQDIIVTCTRHGH